MAPNPLPVTDVRQVIRRYSEVAWRVFIIAVIIGTCTSTTITRLEDGCSTTFRFLIYTRSGAARLDRELRARPERLAEPSRLGGTAQAAAAAAGCLLGDIMLYVTAETAPRLSFLFNECIYTVL